MKGLKSLRVSVYAKEDCSISGGMGKYIPVQTNRKITGEVLIESSDKTIPGLVLPEIVYNIKKKLGYIFVENHNSESMYGVEERTDCRVSEVMHSDIRGARSNKVSQNE